MASLEEQRKILLPILKRADEVQQQEPKVAYYCRLYAVHQALSFEKRQPDIDGIVMVLMSKLEQDKQKLQLSDTDEQHCETFAQLIFNRAEKRDQAGRWDQDTIRAYYSASYFIEICKQFGELPPDMAQMQKFAAWKASDLRKAIREGRDPTPRSLPSATVPSGDLDDSMPGVPSGGLPQTLPKSFQSLDSMPRGGPQDNYLTSSSSGMPADPEAPASGAHHESPSQPISMPGSKASPDRPPYAPPPPYTPPPPCQAPEYSPAGGARAGHPQQPPSNDSPYPSPPGLYGPPSAVHPSGMPSQGMAGGAEMQRSAGGQQVLHRFSQGDSVHHKASATAPTQPAKIVGFFTRPDGQQLYTVAVAGSSQPIPATADHLAQNFEPGERVLFRPPDHRPPSEASVNQTDLTHWRPVYHITCDHGEVCSTGDECLTRLAEEPRDPLMPPSSLPSKISTSPSEEAETLMDPYSPAPGTPKSSARTPPAFSFPATSGPGHDTDGPSAPQGPPDSGFEGYPSFRDPGQQPTPPPLQQPPWQQPQQPSAFTGSAPLAPPPHAAPQVDPALRPPTPPTSMPAGSLTYDPIPGFEPSLSEVTEAHKLSKYAASALSFEDIPTAIKHLTDALKLLTQPNQLKASRYPPTR
ncbi:hypothetical protein WJX84_002950 [Apatococcus fuscideae]|uniref:Vacuolar protein sorting-associated protein VTA1 homolog n=1 Tax=Apatococcus fuscideae TaxID=2026836 RepID=A0AAW1T8H0_9CHLO